MILVGLVLAGSAGFIALRLRSSVNFAQKTREQFRQLDATFDGVRLPRNYVLIREERTGSAYPAPFNDTAPSVVRTFQVIGTKGIPADLMKALRDQGFNLGTRFGCFFEAIRGRVHFFIDYAGEPKPMHGGGLQCPNPSWKTVTAEMTLLLD